MNSESILLYAVKAFAAFIRILPEPVAFFVGRVIGWLGYMFDHKHKSIAYANLKIAFAREKKSSEIKRILRKAFQNYAENLIDLLRFPLIDPKTYIEVEGREYVEQAIAKKKGVIFLAMHFGSWELCNFLPQIFNHPYNVIVNPQKRYTKLNDLLDSYRHKVGAKILTPGSAGTREFIKCLKNGEMVGMVVDQGGKEGNLIKFFGRDASMSTGAIKIGLKLDVAVCFGVLVRERNPHRHRLIIHPPLELKKNGNREEDVDNALKGIVGNMEKYIRQYPAEYMWFYKIWKYSKESTIVVLNDGKMGHLHQSMAVAKGVEQALAEREIKSRIEVIGVEFKTKAKEAFFAGISFISHRRVSQGRLRYLKWFLNRKSFLEVMSVKGDFVISCGSSTAGVNYFLSQDYRAKSIVIQKPGVLNLNRYDLVILPEHDRTFLADKSDKVLYTKIAPNLITPAYIQDQAKHLVMKFPALAHKPHVSVGIFFGGNSKNFLFPPVLAKNLMDQITEAVSALNGRLVLTTSRRTPLETEEAIKESLSDFRHCPLAVFPSEHNIPEAAAGILGLSDIVIVSSDSISMVSEAVSSGKIVIVFKAQKRFPAEVCKHDIFVKNLADAGHVLLVEPENIGALIVRIAKEKLTTKPIYNDDFILNTARKII